MMSEERITFNSFINAEYAQYKDVIKITFKPQNKRKMYYSYRYKDMLIYRGWHNLPIEVLNNVTKTGTGTIITQSLFSSCDKQQYAEIIKHFAEKNIMPVVNTYKPIF